MPLKQQSLFSFDEPLVNDILPTEKLLPKVEDVQVVKDEIIDISFTPWDEKPVVEKSKRGRKKLKDIDADAGLIEVPDDATLFEKKYYSIGIVAKMFKVNISHIRFWEKEFDVLKPKLNAKGDRHFRPEDVKNLQLIYHLLREKKYTIEGARDFMKKNKNAEETFKLIEDLQKLKLFLNDLRVSL